MEPTAVWSDEEGYLDVLCAACLSGGTEEAAIVWCRGQGGHYICEWCCKYGCNYCAQREEAPIAPTWGEKNLLVWVVDPWGNPLVYAFDVTPGPGRVVCDELAGRVEGVRWGSTGQSAQEDTP